MNYCPKCGTANRTGSRFCNECGEELGSQTQVECSRCGTQNPVQNILCSHCGARLLPTASSPSDVTATPTIKGLSLPTKNSVSQQDEEAGAGPEPEPEDEIPAWLRELGASISKEGGSDVPESVEDTGDVPDWLRDLRASLPKDREEPAEPEERVPDWLTTPEPETAEPTILHEPDEHDSELELEEAEAVGETLVSEPDVEPQPPQPDAEPEDELAAPEPTEDEVPGWLSRLVPTATDQRGEIEPTTSAQEDAPGWLTRLVPSEEETETEVIAAGPEATEDKVSGKHDEPVPAEEEARPQPDELEALPDGIEAQPTQPSAEIEEDEIPAWPAEIRAAEEDTESEEAAPVFDFGETQVPDWMADLQPADEEAEGESVTSEIEIEKGEIPEWVAELRPVDEEAEHKPSLPAIEIADEEELPDRVTELEPPTEEIPLAEALDSPSEERIEPATEKSAYKLPAEVEAVLGRAVPAWLEELQVEAPEAAAAIIEETMVDGELPDWLVHSEIEPDESLAPAEIPAWLLALKPTELRKEGEEAERPPSAIREGLDETGLLAGIPGILPVEMLIAQPRAITVAEGQHITVEDSPPAQLFGEVVGRPREAAPKTIAISRAATLSGAARWFIYALLIVVVALPIIIGEPLLDRTVEATAATVDMHAAIESLDSGTPVLVAFDYDPTSSGEMDLIARALIGHLMDKEARVVVVSLLPAGPATAQSLLEKIAADRPSYAEGYGERYANLGYLPGQAAAVRLLGISFETALPRDFFGTPLDELPLMQELDSTQAFSLIIELAASHETMRWWIEQAAVPYSMPLGAGASAAVLPYARPYYETEPRQLVGVLGGVPDAVTYEALTSEENSPTGSSAARLDSQLAGHLVFVLVLLGGNVVYLVRRGSRRER